WDAAAANRHRQRSRRQFYQPPFAIAVGCAFGLVPVLQVELESVERRGQRGRAAVLAPAAANDAVAPVSPVSCDDLEREVYCVLGLPIDALDMQTALRYIDAAAANRTPLFISTPNLNFLANSRADVEFRESLLASDLCPADGMPIIWIA